MYRPCLHCGGHYDENECAQICTYGEERKRLRELENELEKKQDKYPIKTLTGNNSVNYEKRVFEISQELDKMSRLICFKYDAGIHLPEAVIDWMTQEFICLYNADEDYTLMPDEVITLRLMLRYIQREDL